MALVDEEAQKHEHGVIVATDAWHWRYAVF